MHENDHESFYKYSRMTSERFDNLLLLVGPMLTKKSLYREPISAGDKMDDRAQHGAHLARDVM